MVEKITANEICLRRNNEENPDTFFIYYEGEIWEVVCAFNYTFNGKEWKGKHNTVSLFLTQTQTGQEREIALKKDDELICSQSLGELAGFLTDESDTSTMSANAERITEYLESLVADPSRLHYMPVKELVSLLIDARYTEKSDFAVNAVIAPQLVKLLTDELQNRASQEAFLDSTCIEGVLWVAFHNNASNVPVCPTPGREVMVTVWNRKKVGYTIRTGLRLKKDNTGWEHKCNDTVWEDYTFQEGDTLSAWAYLPTPYRAYDKSEETDE